MRAVLIILCVVIAGAVACEIEEERQTTRKVVNETSATVFTQPILLQLVRNEENQSDSTRFGRLNILLEGIKDSGIYRRVTNFLSKSFGDPNSPYRNEALAMAIWWSHLRSAFYTAEEKEVVKTKLSLALKNRVGTIASDFSYKDPNGRQLKLHDIRTPFTIIYFYNPDCEACKEMTYSMSLSPTLTAKLNSGELSILALYTDADQTPWRKHLPHLPKAWLHGHDDNETLWRNKVYDLRAIPTLYLLDRSKKVLVKDGTLPQIEQKLIN